MPTCDKCFKEIGKFKLNGIYQETYTCYSCTPKQKLDNDIKIMVQPKYTNMISGKESVEEGALGEKEWARDVERRQEQSSHEFKKILGTVMSQKGYIE